MLIRHSIYELKINFNEGFRLQAKNKYLHQLKDAMSGEGFDSFHIKISRKHLFLRDAY